MQDFESQKNTAEKLLAGSAGLAHLMGIGGVGMAGLARLLDARQWQVSGCDLSPGSRTAKLAATGITVAADHSATHITRLAAAQKQGIAATLIRSTAVPPDHPEVAAARAAGLDVLQRGALLAAIVSTHPRSIAVCGAHGKTTTTLFTTRLLHKAGLGVEWCIGGEAAALGEVAGSLGDPTTAWLVAEADESDGTLALYRPQVAVLTNIDVDHLEHFSGMAELTACYRQTVSAARRGVAWCADDPLATSLCHNLRGLSFGFGESAAIRAADIECGSAASSFTLYVHNSALARITIDAPGQHNILNALAALAAAALAGVPLETAATLLSAACSELPLRRFETVTHLHGCRIVADYAPHPREIAALIAMSRPATNGQLCVIFQPHRYTRTLALRDSFPPAFDGADLVVLLPVFAASESPIHGGESEDLYAAFRHLRPNTRVILASSATEAWHAVQSHLTPGNMLLLTGAGDVITLADNARAAAATPPPDFVIPHATPMAPLGSLTTLGTGGTADWLADVTTTAALREVIQAAAKTRLPLSIFGAGANTLIADSGVRGVVIRLCGPNFSTFTITTPNTVEVGCGLKGAALLSLLQEHGLSGLEFLDAIPGTVGGWLAMNAGAHGGNIGNHVTEIECLSFCGTNTILTPSQCGFSYRNCPGLEGNIALKVRLSLKRASPEEIANRRATFRQRRVALAGLRTAGSVFRNPAGNFAGKLLEDAGCKEMSVGGAYVCAHHANVIVAAKGATASDVAALLNMLQREAKRHSGVTLTPEIRILR